MKGIISMEDLKFMGLKSHDCHVLMQDLLLVAIRGILRQVIEIKFRSSARRGVGELNFQIFSQKLKVFKYRMKVLN